MTASAVRRRTGKQTSREATATPPAPNPKPREATVHEAKTHLSRLLKDIEAGETIVITRRGRPVATLEPLTARAVGAARVPGSMKGRIAIDDRFFEPLPDDVLKAWEGD